MVVWFTESWVTRDVFNQNATQHHEIFGFIFKSKTKFWRQEFVLLLHLSRSQILVNHVIQNLNKASPVTVNIFSECSLAMANLSVIYRWFLSAIALFCNAYLGYVSSVLVCRTNYFLHVGQNLSCIAHIDPFCCS